MVNGMANRETSELGGEGVAVYLKGLISWVLTPARKRKEKINGDQEGCRLGLKPQMRVDNSTGKGTSGMDKFSSKVHRMHMELGGKLLFEKQDAIATDA